MAPITLEQVVRNAVKAERAAETFYRNLAERTDDRDARAFLVEMADQEREHAVAIEAFGSRLDAGSMTVGADWKVEQIETAPEWCMQDGLTLKQAMDIAMENEQHAELYYDALADAAEGEAANFLRTLSRAEGEHYQRIRRLTLHE